MPYLDLGAKETGGLDLGAQESSSTLALTESASDAISLSDAAAHNFGSIYSFVDISTITDLLDIIVISNKKKEWELLLSEGMSFGDSMLAFATYATAVAESNTITDAVSLHFNRFSLFSDAISLSDNLFSNANSGDTLTFSDGVAYSLAVVQPTDYAFLLTDQLVIGEVTAHIEVPDFLHVGDALILSDRITARFQSNVNNYLRRYLNDVPTPLS